ncbi:MAG: PAS domain-containing protein [Akkermansiaceae bacterium]|nr:PAS domain-containing protein [Akkermansiaceae bacterium]
MIPFLSILCAVLAAGLVVSVVALYRTRAAARRERMRLATEQERALETLNAEQNVILDALSDAFFLVDSDYLIRRANAPARDLLPGREILGRSLGEIFLHKNLAKPIRKAIKTGRRVTKNILLPHPVFPGGGEDQSGVTAWVIDAAPIEVAGSPPLTRVIVRDVTAEYQTEQVRKDFVANASHELRTPLAIINGYLENLVDDDLVEDPETSRRFLTIMRKHADRISRIVEDMLVIARLESGEAGQLKMEPFAFEACAHDVLERLQPLISAQGSKVRLAAAPEGLAIVGDRFYWTQILFNLVENALKQNPARPLDIEIGYDAEGEADGSVRIWVTDNGVGIPSADLPFIFRRFYRVEKHHSQGTIRGTGLGLSIVKRAVEAHGGEITASSTPGEETRFEIVLPPEAVAPREAEVAGGPM